jgi:hypothetical protein
MPTCFANIKVLGLPVLRKDKSQKLDTQGRDPRPGSIPVIRAFGIGFFVYPSGIKRLACAGLAGKPAARIDGNSLFCNGSWLTNPFGNRFYAQDTG